MANLGRPGGNVTELSYYSTDLVEKRLQLFKEMVPLATRVAVLENPESAHVFGMYGQDAERAARGLGLRLLRVQVSQPADLGRSFDAMAKADAQGLLVLTDPMLSAHARRIAELAAQHRLPGMYWALWFVEGAACRVLRRLRVDGSARAYYVDKILKGAKPGTPDRAATTFELVITSRLPRHSA